MSDLIDLVNPLCGSDSEPTFSTGLTYPAVQRPWGMLALSPRNRPGGQVFSRRRSWPVNRVDGFTVTHAPSHWMGDYGSFTLTPGVDGSGYRLIDEVARPDRYAVTLLTGVRCEITATRHCGLLRLTYPTIGAATLALRLHSDRCEARPTPTGLAGVARDGHLVGDFANRFVVDVDAPTRPAGEADGGRTLLLRVEVPASRVVNVRVGTSFIDADHAAAHLRRELGDRPFDAVADELAAAWEAELGRVRVDGGTRDRRRTFYTCLWRSLLFPRELGEPGVGRHGGTRHRSPYTGEVRAGNNVTDNGFWDTSRTVYPLLSLAYPRRLGRLLGGWVTAYRQSGWMPQWASPGHRACMVGTHSAAVFADAICKGIGGFDHRLAFESMVKDATVPGDPGGRWGRQQLDDYHRLGYCPEVGGRDSLCRTLDYSYNDWCCARVADALGEDAAGFDARAGSWRNLFDAKTGFLRPRDAAGAFVEPFREFAWGGPYREGGPWQYRFAVPHDPAGLDDLLNGRLADEIDRMATIPPTFEVGHYGTEIHEMTEMAAAGMGQYAHSNQPVHGVLWKPARVGRPDVTDRLVRRVLTELYSPDAYPGDEDNGEMAAWFVLAALGLGPHCPGDPAYTATPMLFDAATVRADDGRTFALSTAMPADRRVTHAALVGSA